MTHVLETQFEKNMQLAFSPNIKPIIYDFLTKFGNVYENEVIFSVSMLTIWLDPPTDKFSQKLCKSLWSLVPRDGFSPDV